MTLIYVLYPTSNEVSRFFLQRKEREQK